MTRRSMENKRLVFVTTSLRPAVAPVDAAYVRTHPDGSPMIALSSAETMAECAARWQAAQGTEKAAGDTTAADGGTSTTGAGEVTGDATEAAGEATGGAGTEKATKPAKRTG